MTPRAILLFSAALSLLVAGCGDPAEAVFVSSDQTKALVRDAQRPVQQAIDDSFGTPQNLVAWRKLPVDFGEIEGTVSEGEGFSLENFTATLTTKDGKPAEIDPAALRDSAVLWLSGEKANLKYDLRNVEDFFQFRVANYEPTTKRLSVRISPRLTPAEASTIAPQPGEKFTIVGPVLKHGRALYMTHCLHCHGVSGDGNGPTAQYLNPRPRDYRLGLFKFTSTQRPEKAQHEDLARIVRDGIPGTYMPSFLLLKDNELHAIVEYVRWLAMRGELEIRLTNELRDYTTTAFRQRQSGGESAEEINAALTETINGFPDLVETASTDLAESWTRGETPESTIIPKKKRTDDTSESRARGRELYLSAKAKCATCHGPMARGDGPQTEDFQPKPGSSEKYAVPGLHDDWGNPQTPRDLTRGIYRGGRRPIDLYRRVYAGIKGTQMPPFNTVLNDDEIWDLVNYVMSIPYDGPGAPPKSPIAPSAPTTASVEQNRQAGSLATLSGNGGN